MVAASKSASQPILTYFQVLKLQILNNPSLPAPSRENVRIQVHQSTSSWRMLCRDGQRTFELIALRLHIKSFNMTNLNGTSGFIKLLQGCTPFLFLSWNIKKKLTSCVCICDWFFKLWFSFSKSDLAYHVWLIPKVSMIPNTIRSRLHKIIK